MALNAQQKRVSKNRVSITYDVETNGATQTKELPFVIGLMGGYSGDRVDRPPAEDRKFVELTRDNLDAVMKGIAPRLTYKVADRLAGGDGEVEVDLRFSSMSDFSPDAIVDQVESLGALAQTREKLMTLLSRADRSRDLEKILKEVMQDPDALKALREELGVGAEKEGKK